MDRTKIIEDRLKVQSFIVGLGKKISEQIMGENVSDKHYISVINGVIKKCNEYPENAYGKPSVYDVMSVAYRHINYQLDIINMKHGIL